MTMYLGTVNQVNKDPRAVSPILSTNQHLIYGIMKFLTVPI